MEMRYGLGEVEQAKKRHRTCRQANDSRTGGPGDGTETDPGGQSDGTATDRVGKAMRRAEERLGEVEKPFAEERRKLGRCDHSIGYIPLQPWRPCRPYVPVVVHLCVLTSHHSIGYTPLQPWRPVVSM